MPLKLIEYQLSEKFGWTPSEIRRESYSDIMDFLAIMDIQRKEDNRKRDNANRKNIHSSKGS